MSTGFILHWDPPSNSSINGEFLGYILTVRPKDDQVKKIIEVKDETLEPQKFSLSGLLPHTTYILTLAAKNLEGLGPEAVIELRTEAGGEHTNNKIGNNNNNYTVPLQPRQIRIEEVTSRSVVVRWRLVHGNQCSQYN